SDPGGRDRAAVCSGGGELFVARPARRRRGTRCLRPARVPVPAGFRGTATGLSLPQYTGGRHGANQRPCGPRTAEVQRECLTIAHGADSRTIQPSPDTADVADGSVAVGEPARLALSDRGCASFARVVLA